MPPTNLSTEVSTKKATRPQAKDPEWKKALLRDADAKSVESGNRSVHGGGETPAVPAKTVKPKKPREKKLADTLPKKNAQRAKGSISLNKTIEQAEVEAKPCLASCEKIGKCDAATTPPEETKNSPQAPRRKKKLPQTPRESGEKPDRKASPKRKPSLVQTPSCVSVEEKTLEVVNQEPVEVKSDEIRAVSTGFNSCSFFEKIQQGVKAYFSSRGSFNPEDRTKKEGGNRKRGRGVFKEEKEKSRPGKLIKKIIPERVSLCDRLRYLGGHSSTFLSTKPKLLRRFRKLKRKKLYHPKKCYVRIQIPRKGYFYRSTVGLQNPEHASQPRAKNKVDPKSPISGLAPACSKAARLPNKKELNKQEPPLDNGPDYMDRLLSEFRDQSSAGTFEKKVSEYVALNWPENGEVSLEDALVQFEYFRPEGERQISAISENFNDQETKNGFYVRELDPSWNGFASSHIIYNLELDRKPCLNSIEEETEGADPAPVASGGADSFDVAASLMGGLDLHLELQNYIKAIEGFHSARGRTKNTLQCNIYDNYIPLKIYSSSQDLQKRAEEYFDVNETKSGSSFDSAASDCSQLEEVTHEMLLDVTANGPGVTMKKNTVKRTGGITSFQVFRLDDKTTWGPSYLRAEYKKHNGGHSADGYEKIQPLGAPGTERKSISSFLFRNSAYSVSHTSSEQLQSQIPVSSTGIVYQQDQNGSWSPTLQELIDIYNSVLKQNTKIRRSSKQSLSRRISTHLFSFLNEKLREKHYKSDLLNLSKDFRMKSLTKLGNPVKSSSDLMKLEEYVAMFQEILHSSLSIHQITRLNNILAGLQDYSEKNYNYVKDLKEDVRKVFTPEKVETPPPSPRPKTSTPIKPKKSVRFETPKKQPKTEPTEKKVKKPRKPKAKAKTKTKPTETDKKELPVMAELESVLKLCAYDGVLKEPEMSDERKKLLVTVKLKGNQVLVSGMSHIENENTLKSGKRDPNGTSELIIENVTKTQMSGDVWWKNTKSSRLRMQNQEKTNKPVKTPPKKGVKKPKRTKPTETPQTQQFEYDQFQLRVQHPIEAIAETSESKVSQQAEDEQRKVEPPPETKILLQDIPPNPTAMKEVLKAALQKKVYSKDLVCDFGWSEENIGRTSTRKTKRRPTPKNKHAVMVRSLVDLKKRTPTKQKTRKTQPYRRSYMCYSTVQNPGKTKKTQKTNTRSGSPAVGKAKTTKITEKPEVCGKSSNEGQQKKAQMTRERPTTAETVLQIAQPVELPANGCELEFLFSEDKKPDPTPEETQTTPSVASVASLEKEPSFCSAKKESSIALLPPSGCNDCVSFLAEMIHSDSFLSNIPPHAVSHSKLNSLFKSSSEVKFYPGRLTEGGSGEEKPLVTFVLTPSQNEQAQLPQNQVTIVKKGEQGAPSREEKKKKEERETAESDAEEGREEISLRSIEEFISYLSKCRRIVENKRKAKAEADEKKPNSAKSFQQKSRVTTVCRPSGVSLPAHGKTYHECQKRKPPPVIKKKTTKPPITATKQRKKKNVQNSDLFLNKIVDNLSRALENLRKEKLAKTNENRETKETNTEQRAKPEDPMDISKEVVEAIKMAITHTEGEKKQANAAVGDGIAEEMQNVGTTCDDTPKKTKALKIKIHCNDPKRQLESGETVNPYPEEGTRGEIDLLDSLVSREVEGGDLRRRQSTYFDAVERSMDVKMGGDTNNVYQTTAEGTLDLNVEFGVTEERECLFTTSEEQLLSKNVLGKKSEEIIYSKITKTLQEGQTKHSMALLETFLSKGEDNCVRLRKLLALVETRSRNIMLNMERKAWMKVLSLLEEVSQVFDRNDIRDSTKVQLETTKDFIERIQMLNVKRLVDLQHFCSKFANPPEQEEDNRTTNVLDRIKQSLKVLKQKFTLKRNDPTRNLENLDRTELKSSGSGFKIHSTVSLPEIREEQKDTNDAEELKRKLQQGFLCMQELLKVEDMVESVNVPPEIQDVRKRVAEKIKVLEKAFEGGSLPETSREASGCWNRATSLLRLARGCRKEEEGAPQATGEVGLSRRPGYLNLMKCLLKAWDTRMTMSSITSECFT